MCGIAGELRFDGATPDLAVIERMKVQLARRGPDGEGSYCDGPVVLGHRRLSIIDLSNRAHQPMVDEMLGLALVFNGTIYNYPELRSKLQSLGHHFISTGDTEVILRAYAEWGEQCVEKLHGMFAFALWDRRKQCLFCARDRLGIKPFYFSHTGKHFRFASNSQALLAAGDVDTSIDPVALHHQFALHAVVPAPRTILNGVRKLAPGTTLTIDVKGNKTTRQYWHLRAQRPAQPKTELEWQEAIHDALAKAVKKRLTISDVPVGVLLSGGLDSSLLVALLAEQGMKDLITFSIGFEDQPEEKGSEFEHSDAVAQHFNTQHHQYRIANDEVLRRLPEAIINMAEPMVGQDAVAFYLLAECVSKSVKVVLSGQGADEVFGGYFWYNPMAADTQGTAVDRFRRHYFDRDHDEFLETVTAAYHGADYTAQTVTARLAEAEGDTFIDQVLRMDVTMLITDDPVKRVDNMTMAWGLEARVPFLDHELVELAAQMPPELKLASGGKHILKKIARGRLPDSVIDRPKGYFPMPALKYVRGDFLELMRSTLDSRACRERGLFNRVYIEKLLAAPERYLTRIQGNKLWHLALLELWLQQNVDGIRYK
ncbi:MAG: N-acetylglutaminylglutamine amidotransferase [Gammaproteobacteria bacterium]|nr:N-acetylglutaminylglutamine amidotransferase [Gammaproteobacteria bacterium]